MRENARKCEASRNPKIPKNENPRFSLQQSRTSARKPVSRGPPIELHLLGYSGPIWDMFVFVDVRPTGQKPKKWCRNCYLFPFPWRKQPLGPCPSQRAPDLEVHSQIESSVRPNGTPIMPLLHFGQVRRSSATCIIDFMFFFNAFWG